MLQPLILFILFRKSMPSQCSSPTNYYMVERGGFEPPKAEPADLQSAPFGHSGTSPWSHRRDSNPRPDDYKSTALPTELRWLELFNIG